MPSAVEVTRLFALEEFGPETTPAQIARVDAAFTALERKVIEPRQGLGGDTGLALTIIAGSKMLRRNGFAVSPLQLLEQIDRTLTLGVRRQRCATVIGELLQSYQKQGT